MQTGSWEGRCERTRSPHGAARQEDALTSGDPVVEGQVPEFNGVCFAKWKTVSSEKMQLCEV